MVIGASVVFRHSVTCTVTSSAFTLKLQGAQLSFTEFTPRNGRFGRGFGFFGLRNRRGRGGGKRQGSWVQGLEALGTEEIGLHLSEERPALATQLGLVAFLNLLSHIQYYRTPSLFRLYMDASANEDVEFLRARPTTGTAQGQLFEMRALRDDQLTAVEEAKAPPVSHTSPSLPQRNSAPGPRPQPLSAGQVISCCYCQTRLMYPSGAYCVRCPRCAQVTAVQQLRKMMCPYCRTVMMFPSTAKLVLCTCRNTFATVPGVIQVPART